MAIGALLVELLYVLGGLAALWFAWQVLEWGWLSPRRLGRALRAQGLRGTVYRFPAGDVNEARRRLAAERDKPMPLHSHDVSARAQPLIHHTIKEHGKISMFWTGPKPSVILHDPKLVREVLSNKFGHFKKADLPSRFIKLIGEGLANHQDEKWAVHRKIINHAFLLEKLKKMLPAFTTCTNEMVQRWIESVGSGKAQEIDVWPELQDLTGDAISRAAFGSSINEGRRIFRIQSEQIELATHMTNLYIPGYTFLPTKVNRKINANAREVETLLKGIITKKERAMKKGQADDSDMLGLLLQSNAQESQESGSSKPMMTVDDIIGELKLFYFAGMETTSVLLTWTMILLSMNPEWQDRTREEVLRVFGSKQPDLDGANQLKIVETLLKGIITKKERAMKNGQADDSDMLGLLLQSNAKESQVNGTSNPIMTIDDIIGELKLFYCAGMDTSSVLLTWTMILLSMNPEWQDREREEVLRVFGSKQPDLDGMNQLKIVTMVVYEVLRLYPPFTVLERETSKEVELGGFRYPAGVKLVLPVVFIHHDPALWGDDADEFRPERCAEGISKASKDAPAFFPFGWGPRICIGQNFALLEAKIALSMILQRFEFSLSPSYTHAPFPVTTLQPSRGAQIKLKKI